MNTIVNTVTATGKVAPAPAPDYQALYVAAEKARIEAEKLAETYRLALPAVKDVKNRLCELAYWFTLEPATHAKELVKKASFSFSKKVGKPENLKEAKDELPRLIHTLSGINAGIDSLILKETDPAKQEVLKDKKIRIPETLLERVTFTTV